MMVFVQAQCRMCKGSGIVVGPAEIRKGRHIGTFCETCEGLGMVLCTVEKMLRQQLKPFRGRTKRIGITRITLTGKVKKELKREVISMDEFCKLDPAPAA